MSENLPDSFDSRQPDLPTLAVDPDPDAADGQDTRKYPETDVLEDVAPDEEGRTR